MARNKRNINSGHRGNLDIIADILEASQTGTRKTYLMYHCNLSFRQLKHYLTHLNKTGLLCAVVDNGGRNSDLFKTTEKGIKFLKIYRGLKALLKPS
ncbi:MAG: winged helix-turn-helix domain-containing protein [Candidatus Bathyarchaeia archaeon]